MRGLSVMVIVVMMFFCRKYQRTYWS